MPTTLAKELTALQQKREALEQLIHFAKQIVQSSDGLDAVQLITSPSQKPDDRQLGNLDALIKHFDQEPNAKLSIHMENLDSIIGKKIHEILEIANTSEEQFKRKFARSSLREIKTSYEVIGKKLIEFKRYAQSSAAVRIVLQQRRIQVKPAKFPVLSNILNEQVNELKSREVECKRKVKNEITALINDTDKLMQKEGFPKEMISQMQQTHQHLSQALESLNAGNSLEDISVYVESIELGDVSGNGIYEKIVMPDDDENKAKNSEQAVPQTENSKPKPPPASKPPIEEPSPMSTQAGFFRILKLWLFTPWKIRWRDIKARENQKD